MVVDTLRLEQDCQKGRPGPLYLFFGEEDFLLEQAVRRLEEAASRCPFPAREHYRGGEVSARDLMESACTLPLGGSFRLLVVEEAQAIPAAERDKLLPYLENPCPTSCLVFTWRAKKLEAKDKFAALLKRKAKIFGFARLRAGELKAWARARAKAMGLAVEPAALEALIEGSGGSLRDLAAELDKAALSAKGGRLTTGDLAALSRHGSQTIFRLAELACGGDTAGALLALADVMEAGTTAGTVLRTIAQRVRKLLLAAELSARGASEEEVASELRTFRCYVSGYLAQARRGRPRLARMLSEVLEAEFDLKTSSAPERERLERLVMSLGS
jgi:DNA polymerase-3 subunit delta